MATYFVLSECDPKDHPNDIVYYAEARFNTLIEAEMSLREIATGRAEALRKNSDRIFHWAGSTRIYGVTVTATPNPTLEQLTETILKKDS